MTARDGPRVVSLVPSITETLLAWGVAPVGCTRFCHQPGIATVGGTKTPDVDAVVALAPDLVAMNDEENRREDAETLVAAGLSVHSCSPRTVAEVPPALGALAATLGVAGDGGADLWEVAPLGARVFVPIWRRPLMSMNGATYGSSVLAALGLDNVCAHVPERYPEVTLGEAADLAPDLVLVPSEPYPFRSRHLDELAAVAPPVLIDGEDLFWWGVRTPAAIGRLHRRIADRLDRTVNSPGPM